MRVRTPLSRDQECLSAPGIWRELALLRPASVDQRAILPDHRGIEIAVILREDPQDRVRMQDVDETGKIAPLGVGLHLAVRSEEGDE